MLIDKTYPKGLYLSSLLVNQGLFLTWDLSVGPGNICESTTVAPEEDYVWRQALQICDFSVPQLFVSGHKQFPGFVPHKNVQCRINVYGQPQSLLEIEVLN